jgi:predicted ATPase
MAPKSKDALAREHLNRGLENLEGDASEAAYWLFLAAEAAVVFLAEKNGIASQKNHPAKVTIAEELVERQIIAEAIPDLLKILNQARKDTMYEGEELNLDGWSLEDVAIEIETLVDKVGDGD